LTKQEAAQEKQEQASEGEEDEFKDEFF